VKVITSVIASMFCLGTASCSSVAEEAPPAESALTDGNCSFIPGCRELLESSDGPFHASVMTRDDGSGARSTFSIGYRRGALDFCSQIQARRRIRVLFVTGPEHARESVEREMSISCPQEWGDNPGSEDRASWSVGQQDDPALWDALFPRRPDGSRWYAVQVAATNDLGEWDSRYGDNYRLVLKARQR